MMVNDPIADFITRLRNAIERKKESLSVPSSKILEAIASILKDEGFILDYNVEVGDGPQKELTLDLKYVNGKPTISKLTRVSKPGVRIYSGYKDLARVKHGLGISILTTPKGVMTGKKAREEQVGGELLCTIW
ncbi:30S ribosomal protein S8 [Candidatus Dojkabacteria bacterium]|nr:30S ribosomal protein S8 [Candidatus Dojkabacteria bacterium]